LKGKAAQAIKAIQSFLRVAGNIFKPALIIILVIAAALLFLRTPMFLISDIEIIGNARLTDEYIKDVMNIRDDTIFFWNAPAAQNRLLANHYVDRVDVTVDYFSRHVTVRIRERLLSGYVEYVDGLFLYIDDRGQVLESVTVITERLPVVVGLEFSRFTLGEPLPVANPDSFNRLTTLAQLFNQYQVGEDIIKVDVSKPDDIRIYVRDIDVEFGDINGADQKVRMMRIILSEHLNDPDQRGTLNIRDPNRPPAFRPMQ